MNGSSAQLLDLNGTTGNWVVGNTGQDAVAVRFPDRVELTVDGEKTYVFGTNKRLNRIVHFGGYEQVLAYDGDGQLTGVVDSFGRSISFETNEYGNITKASFDDGEVVKYTYIQTVDVSDLQLLYPSSDFTGFANSANVLSTVILPDSTPATDVDNPTLRYHYEDTRDPGLLTGYSNELGIRYATWAYDANKRAVLSTHADGVDNTTLLFDDVGNTVTVTNALGRQTIYRYSLVNNSSRRLTAIDGQVSPNCPATSQAFTYDSNSFLTSWTDAESRRTTYTNDALGRATATTYNVGGSAEVTIATTWHSQFNVPTKVVAPGLTTDYVRNALGQLTSVTQTDTTTHTLPYPTMGQTRTWTYTYGVGGLLETIDGPLSGSGDRVSYSYSTSGYLQSITNELGHVTTIDSVNGRGLPTLITNANGITLALGYNSQGYLTSSTTDPAGANLTVSYVYDATGNLVQISRPDGTQFSYTYDSANRLEFVVDASGNKITYAHDAMGNVVSEIIANASSIVGFEQTANYDELGRLLRSVGAYGQTWQYNYDKVGNLTAVEDPRGGAQVRAFDGLNRLVSIVDQASKTQSLGRNAQGAIVAYTDGKGVETTFVRNGWGEVIEEKSPDIGAVVYERNALGSVTKKTDARGVVANYSYDVMGRLTGVGYPAAPVENVTYAYDSVVGGNLGKGYLTQIDDQVGSTIRTYNSLGLLASESMTLLGTTATTGYTYDAAGNLFYITYPSGRRVSYWRNANGEVSSVAMRQSASAPLTDIAFDIGYLPFGDIRYLMFENGLNLWRTFDRSYRPAQLALYDGAGSMMSRYHGYQDGLNLTSIWDNKDSANDQSYWYAANNELQNADGPWGEETYYTDNSGNRTWHIKKAGGTTTEDRLYYGAINRLNAIERNGSPYRTFTSDLAGNILTDTAGGSVTAYGYNNADRLRTVTKAGVKVGEYTYNAFGQLVVRAVSGTAGAGISIYFYDQEGHVIAEFDGSTGAVTREYIWLGDRPLAVVDPGAGGADTVYYVHADHLNRPIAMTDSSKAIVADFVWLPFGGLYSYTGSVGLDLRFPGQMFQAESGLHYNWNRHYDPTTGRYTQPDPLGLVDAPTRFAYVNGDPLQQVDPSGEQVIPPDRMSHIINGHGFYTPRTGKGNSKFLPQYSTPSGVLDLASELYRRRLEAKPWYGGLCELTGDFNDVDLETGASTPHLVGVDSNGNLTNSVTIRFNPNTGVVATMFPVPRK